MTCNLSVKQHGQIMWLEAQNETSILQHGCGYLHLNGQPFLSLFPTIGKPAFTAISWIIITSNQKPFANLVKATIKRYSQRLWKLAMPSNIVDPLRKEPHWWQMAGSHVATPKYWLPHKSQPEVVGAAVDPMAWIDMATSKQLWPQLTFTDTDTFIARKLRD